MKTISYNEMLYRAAEAAGRTRDNLPLAEAAVLKSIFALELRKLWLSEDWDDLRQPILMVALDGTKSFSNVQNATTLGDVLGVYTQDPNGSVPYTRVDFFRTGDTYTAQPGDRQPLWGSQPIPATVYVYYQADCPDLLAITDPNTLATTTIPLAFGNILALRGAGHLLAADGAASLAGVQFGLANTAETFERSRIQRPKWARTE